MLYVKADGSVQDYDTVQAFLTDHPEQKYHYLEYYMGGTLPSAMWSAPSG